MSNLERVENRVNELTEFDQDQIEAAASGCIDKYLKDWVYLNQALRKVGIDVPPLTTARTLTVICQFVMAIKETNEKETRH